MNEQSTGPSRALEVSERDVQLANYFVALADTLVDDFDVVDFLDGLVRACVDLLGVGAVGLLLIDQRGSLQVVASSSEEMDMLELLQLERDGGPCVECVRSGTAITVPDLEHVSERWPEFVMAAVGTGFESAYALPMRLRDQTIGAMNIFSDLAEVLGADELRVAQALADVATIGILQQRSRHRAALLAEQLQTALSTRVVIEQAKGVLAERGGISMHDAFDHLRGYARATRTRLGHVAERVVARELTAQEILAAVAEAAAASGDRR
jgi:GAF domain-containing protein